MGNYFSEYLQRGLGRCGGLTKTVKKNIGSLVIILMLAMGIFFCFFSENYAYAEGIGGGSLMQIEYAGVIPENVKELLGDDLIAEKTTLADYLKDGQGKVKKNISDQEKKMRDIVTGYPIENMLPFIVARNERVAQYLVAIAKKESDWGKYSPQKAGKTCYNYWGYRGTYNQTASGYSCFDSPEQAVRQVGDRIEDLLNKKIDTPEEMIVWKCGSTCAGHDRQGVLKWISDVKLYYNKLNS